MEEIKEEVSTTLNEEKELLKKYQELQKNSVSREQHDKEVAELKGKLDLYLKAITEGNEVEVPSEGKEDIKDLISDLSNFRGTNLEYWDKTTKATDLMLKSLPEQEITKITGSEGLDEVIKVNEVMKQMVKDANGDSDYFRTLYKQRVQDSAPRISAEIEKEGNLISYLSKKTK